MGMVWFGRPQLAPAYSDCGQTETPVGSTCLYCSELIAMGEDGWIYVDGSILHRECSLRMVIGSVAHQEKRCSCHGGIDDHDDGLTRREGARAATAHFEGRHAFHQ